MDRKLLEILCCPATKQSLVVMSSDELSAINLKIAAGQITNADEKIVTQPLEEGLITQNRLRIYRVDDGIPVMLEAESISADQFEDL
ncbi:MAG: Trm112 family protein [Gammaproteobacteria bacterium]|nr:Trm112 family protein [Gammaproteobacteria bacterium]